MMSAVAAIARLTWLRLRRGRMMWITLLLLCVPLSVAGISILRVDDPERRWMHIAGLTLRSLVLLAPVVHLAPALGEELELRTYTYLWSRPVPRVAVLLGKLLVIMPALTLVSLAGTAVAFAISSRGAGETPVAWLWAGLAAVGAGVVAASAFAVGIGALFPRHPLVVAVGWMLFIEQVLPTVPAAQRISTLFNAQIIARLPHDFLEESGVTPLGAWITLGILTVVWLGLAVWRVTTVEPSQSD